jgi:hypothetical protein
MDIQKNDIWQILLCEKRKKIDTKSRQIDPTVTMAIPWALMCHSAECHNSKCRGAPFNNLYFCSVFPNTPFIQKQPKLTQEEQFYKPTPIHYYELSTLKNIGNYSSKIFNKLTTAKNAV